MTGSAKDEGSTAGGESLLRTIRQIVRDELRAVAEGVNEVRQLLVGTSCEEIPTGDSDPAGGTRTRSKKTS